MHRILRQILEVDVLGSEQVGLEVQRQVSDVCRHGQERHLEAALDACNRGDRWLVIDRLEVDLGSVPLAELEAALTTALSAAVASAVRDVGAGGLAEAGWPDRPGLSPGEALLVVVLHVLRHGRLPWWYTSPDARPIEASLVALLSGGAAGGGLDATRRAAFRETLAATLRAESRARERLVRQFARSTLMLLLELLDSRLPGGVAQALHRLEGLALDVQRREALAAALFGAAIDCGCGLGARGVEAAEADALLHLAAARLAPQRTRDEQRMLAQGLALPALPAADPVARPAASPSAPNADLHEGLHVDRAGVVLLHPFLPRFFEILGVARGPELIRPSRALLLLHHLATGALEAEEHELVFAKLLCGVPLEAPVDREPPVGAQEQAEATALLESVVQHWDVLRSTTPDGLRGNFLARPGRLELRDDEWLLRLEPRAWDLLLDRLPWGLGHVKLPWMGSILRVEWPT